MKYSEYCTIVNSIENCHTLIKVPNCFAAGGRDGAQALKTS